MSSIQLENGRINHGGLSGIADHLRAWNKSLSRITESLSVLRREEKELNRMRFRFESEELLKLLSAEVSKSDLQVLRVMAQAKVEQRLQEVLEEAVSNA